MTSTWRRCRRCTARSTSSNAGGRMRRAIALGLMVVGSIVAGAGAAAAQTRDAPWQVAGSYGYLHENGVGGGPSTTYAKGWFVAVDRRIGGGRFRALGEIGGSYHDNAAVETQSLYAYLGGIRVDCCASAPRTSSCTCSPASSASRNLASANTASRFNPAAAWTSRSLSGLESASRETSALRIKKASRSARRASASASFSASGTRRPAGEPCC